MTPEEVKWTYRFHPETIGFMFQLVRDSLMCLIERGEPLPPLISLLITLEFLAIDGFFHTLGLANSISKSSAFRSVERVCTLICLKRDSLIRWLRGHSLQDIKMHFFEKFRLPGIAGIVDGMLIRIKKPADVYMKK